MTGVQTCVFRSRQSQYLYMSNAEAKALGLAPPGQSLPGCLGDCDGFIQFNSDFTFDFDPGNGISRQEQDAFAAQSQQKAIAAIETGRFVDEITPIMIPQRKGEPVSFDTDEQPRAGSTAELLAKLKPAFKKDGSVTAGNASSLNDGAAAVLLMSATKANALGLPVLAKVAAYANAGVDPAIMGIGPVDATRRCLSKAGWSLEQLDLIEESVLK